MERLSTKSVIGILGGIGSGKSSAAAEFAQLGCGVVDADELVSELLQDSVIIQKLVESFGKEIVDQAGYIDRSKLADIVFEDVDKLTILNGIIHPEVFAQTEVLIEQFNSDSDTKAIILDMPLLVETGWDKRCDKLIFVACDESVRLKRTQKSREITKKQLKKRENFQIPLDKKASIADIIVENNSGHLDLVRQVEDIFTKYCG